MWWIVFTIFIQYQGRPPFIEFADAVKSMLMNYEIYSIMYFFNDFKCNQLHCKSNNIFNSDIKENINGNYRN